MIAIGEVAHEPLLMFDLGWERPTLSYFLILMGMWIGVVSLLLWLVEYRGKGKQFAENRVIKYFRLWGMIALSIYVLQIYMLLPRWLFSFLVDDNLLNEKLPYEKARYALLVAVLILLFFNYAIKLWSKVNFKYSFEWFIIRLTKGKRKEVSPRLNVDIMMNGVDWTNYY